MRYHSVTHKTSLEPGDVDNDHFRFAPGDSGHRRTPPSSLECLATFGKSDGPTNSSKNKGGPNSPIYLDSGESRAGSAESAECPQAVVIPSLLGHALFADLGGRWVVVVVLVCFGVGFGLGRLSSALLLGGFRFHFWWVEFVEFCVVVEPFTFVAFC